MREKPDEIRGQRRGPHREVNRRYLIICEGETEKAYFDFVKKSLNSKTIVIMSMTGSSSDQVAVAKEAIKRGMPDTSTGVSGYDEVWAVFDWDEKTDRVEQAKKMLRDAKKTARSKNCKTQFHVALSNPLFEVWYLWHLTDYGVTGCSKNDVLTALKKQCPRYEKGKIPPGVEGHYIDASRRARKAVESHKREGRVFPEDRPRSDIAALMGSIVASWCKFRGLSQKDTLPI